MQNKNRFLIIDGFNYFIRSFSVNPALSDNGDNIGGIIGFLVGTAQLIREHKPSATIIVWDGEGGSLRRRSMLKAYKEGRKIKVNRAYDYDDSSDDKIKNFYQQFVLLQDLLKDLPLLTLQVHGVEADDVIAYTVSKWVMNEDDEKIIVSSDKDFYQLINSKLVVCSHAQKRYINRKYLVENFKTTPENFIFYKALIGDKSDNIKGVKGIGKKFVEKFFPILLEKNITQKDFFEYCDINVEKNKKYKDVIDNKELVINNIKLMQLTHPLISSVASDYIKKTIEKCEVNYRPSNLRVRLLKEGIHIKSNDFFVVMKQQEVFTKKLKEV